MRRRLVLLAALAVLAGACGDDEPSRATDTTEASQPDLDLATTDLADVEVSGKAGERPTLEFEQAFGLEETETRILTEGDGDEVADGTVVRFHFLFLNGRDGSELGTSYETEPAELVFEDSLMAGIYDGLAGVPAGSRVLIGDRAW